MIKARLLNYAEAELFCGVEEYCRLIRREVGFLFCNIRIIV